MLPDIVTSKVVEQDDHWLWTGRVQRNGYGYTHWKRDGRWINVRVHRLYFEEFIGPIPAGLQIHHKCEVRRCVNPAHLEALTPKQHTQTKNSRGAARKTHCKRGHPFNAENTYWDRDGYKACKICRTEAVRRWRARA